VLGLIDARCRFLRGDTVHPGGAIDHQNGACATSEDLNGGSKIDLKMHNGTLSSTCLGQEERQSVTRRHVSGASLCSTDKTAHGDEATACGSQAHGLAHEERWDTRVSELQAQVFDVVAANAQLHKEVEAAERRILEQAKAFRKDVTHKECDLRAAKTEMELQSTRIAQLQGENQSMRQQLQTMQQENDDMQMDKEALISEAIRRKREAAGLQTQILKAREGEECAQRLVTSLQRKLDVLSRSMEAKDQCCGRMDAGTQTRRACCAASDCKGTHVQLACTRAAASTGCCAMATRIGSSISPQTSQSTLGRSPDRAVDCVGLWAIGREREWLGLDSERSVVAVLESCARGGAGSWEEGVDGDEVGGGPDESMLGSSVGRAGGVEALENAVGSRWKKDQREGDEGESERQEERERERERASVYWSIVLQAEREAAERLRKKEEERADRREAERIREEEEERRRAESTLHLKVR
jgi:hypothetical protein